MRRRAPIAIFKSYLFQHDTAERQQISAQRPCRVLKAPLKCIQTSTMHMNVFSLRTRPCSWLLTWTLRAPVPSKCVVSPLPSGFPYHIAVFGSILKTTHMYSQYWVPGSPTQAMMTRQHHGLFIRQNSLFQSGSAHETGLPQSSHCHVPAIPRNLDV